MGSGSLFFNRWLIEAMLYFTDFGAPLEYYHAWNMDRFYEEQSHYMPIINNMGDVKVTAYKDRLINAKYFVMFMW